jgi:5-oxoprolinase (ATP-hydrolysing) subunit C
MTLRVLEPGLYTLVVDFGRPHHRSLGVPIGGAADRTSLALGNALVGNPPDAAALEINLAGPTLEAAHDLACVVYGATFQLASDRQPLIEGRTFTFHAGERIHIGGTCAGMRAYFCVAGGLQTPLILGSRSALEPVQAGAELPCFPGTIAARSFRADFEWNHDWTWFADFVGPYQMLRVLEGPQAAWFPPESFFTPTEGTIPPPIFTVGPASDRMGLRLQGDPLPWPNRELVSEPVCPGSVQVARDGQCIVLGVDGQTIGGYPKVAQVVSADLDRVGQLRPGEQVYFVRVDLQRAEALQRAKQAELGAWVTRLRVSLRP